MKKIIITAGKLDFMAELNDSPTAQSVYDALPMTGSVNLWGDEIYFSIPVHIEQEPDAIQDVEIGDLGFWPAGDAFCIFFGRTPVSKNDKPKAYSPVNIFGHITGEISALKNIKTGTKIHITKEISHPDE
jgi:hypothetical protein